jgi:hypothetical protein
LEWGNIGKGTPITFIERFNHAEDETRLVSLAVIGMDCLGHLDLSLDGPSRITTF